MLLSDIITTPPNPIHIDSEPSAGLTHIVCSDRPQKHAFLTQLPPHWYINTTLNKPPHSPQKTIAIASFDHLMSFLRSFTSHEVVNTLVIDDISTFYWDLKRKNDLGSYSKLLEVLKDVQKRLRVNVIVISWNVNWDNGVRSGRKSTEASYISLDGVRLLYKCN